MLVKDLVSQLQKCPQDVDVQVNINRPAPNWLIEIDAIYDFIDNVEISIYPDENINTLKWIGIRVKDYELNGSKLLEQLAMNGYTYDTNCNDTIFIAEKECDHLIALLSYRRIEYELL